MTRPIRIQLAGAWYHVFNRGARRQAIFIDDRDRRRFLARVGELESRYDVEVHAYCLMGNHYHVLLRTREPNIAAAIGWLIGGYARHFNLRHNFDGPLFRSRYQSVVVDTDHYLLALNRYIHRNPLEAGLVEELLEWRWSSHREYSGVRKPPPWLHMEPTQSMLGMPPEEYQRFVEGGRANRRLRKFYARRYLRPVLGDADFTAKVLGLAQA